MHATAVRFRRLSRVLSYLLGVLIFLFGFLKFFMPFRGWFETQIQQSHLPHEAIILGKIGEMVTGLLFLLPWLWKSLTPKNRGLVVLAACLSLIVQMGTAIYVHLQPQVSANVLPLGIKAPVIPVAVLLLALADAFAALKERQAANAQDGAS